MPDAVTITFDDAAVQVFLTQLGEAARDELRPAAQAGADVLYREMKIRAPVSSKVHYFYGSQFRKSGIFYGQDGGTDRGPTRPFFPGNLRSSIYQVFSADNSDSKKVTYHVSWNKTKAPYGFWVEHGTKKSPASPFLRPAYDARKNDALNVAYDVYLNRLEDRLQRLTGRL